MTAKEKFLAKTSHRLNLLARRGTLPAMPSKPRKMRLGAPCPHCGVVLIKGKTAYVYGKKVICKRRFYERASAQRASRRNQPSRKALPVTVPHSPGFPKVLRCLVCDHPRKASWAGDRIHPGCHRSRAGAIIADADNTVVSPQREDSE
jgi:hypothetical protein